MNCNCEAEYQKTKDMEMKRIAEDITNMIASHVGDHEVTITYVRMTEELLENYTEYARKEFGLLPKDEYFFVTETSGRAYMSFMYAVNVTADSPLTAASELMKLIAQKF